MNAVGRAALAILGLAGFLLVWQSIVVVTRPAPNRRATLGFAASDLAHVAVVALDDRGNSVGRDTLDLAPDARSASAGALRIRLGSLQPSLAAMAPGDAHGELAALVEQAKHDYGGALEVAEIAGSGGATPWDQAAARGRALQNARSVRPAWLPGPFEAIRALAQMVMSGEMIRHVVASLFRVGCGFALAALLGIPLGLMLGSFAWLSALTNSVIQCLRPISPIAWLPVATLALGGGDVAAVFLIFLAAFFPIVVSTAAAVATVDPRYRRSATNFGIRGLAMARRVILPATLPAILTAMRIALGISWVVVVAAEMLGVESGLGYLVLDARNQLRYDRVVAAMIVIGVIGLLIDLSVRRFEREQLARRGLLPR